MEKQVITIAEYEELFRQHYTKLCNAAYQIMNNTDQAEDIVQEVFIRIWEKRDGIEIKNNSFSYLYRSVINACYNEIKRKKVIRFQSPSQNDVNDIGFSQNFETNMDYNKLEDKINQSIENLPVKCRTIFILSRFENYKYKEIAEILDISIKTVEAQMSIAFTKLNTELRPVLLNHFPDILIALFILSLIFKIL